MKRFIFVAANAAPFGIVDPDGVFLGEFNLPVGIHDYGQIKRKLPLGCDLAWSDGVVVLNNAGVVQNLRFENHNVSEVNTNYRPHQISEEEKRLRGLMSSITDRLVEVDHRVKQAEALASRPVAFDEVATDEDSQVDVEDYIRETEKKEDEDDG